MSYKKTVQNIAKEFHFWLRSKGATHSAAGTFKKRKVRKRPKENEENRNQMYVVASFKTMED